MGRRPRGDDDLFCVDPLLAVVSIDDDRPGFPGGMVTKVAEMTTSMPRGRARR